MFPLKSAQPYPRRLWWVAALSEELSDQILARSILGDRIVLCRDENGDPFALYGYCPHRAFPFEMSRLVKGRMQCGYHGIEFNKNGQCVLVPTQSTVPANSSARTYPVVERDGLIWIWTGEPKLADPALVPDAGAIGLGAGWNSYKPGLATIKARYMLLIDNLMDLSHVPFVHARSVPGGGAVVITDATIQETDASLLVQRRATDLPPNPLSSALFPNHKGNYDQNFDAEYYTPAFLRAVGGFYSSATRERLGTFNVLNFITPETPNSVHNWGMSCWDVELGNPNVLAFVKGMGDSIYVEDVSALEAIEDGLRSGNGVPHEISCLVDAGALKARRRIDKLIDAETKAASLPQGGGLPNYTNRGSSTILRTANPGAAEQPSSETFDTTAGFTK